ncbi:MAG: conjugal transfer protein TraX [Ruminococcus bromii]|nr:conjugal transfer protein TraX [Ruminococcus bromii]
MSAFTLKMIALVTMIIDHVGAVFFPEIIWLRYIGRISMPIYAFLLVQGYQHTRDFKRYVIRMAIFAVVSEVPYDLLFHGSWLEFGGQNILFTLLTALLVMRLLDASAKSRNIFLFIGALALIVAPCFLHFSYGIYGVLVPLCFFLFQKYRGIDALAFSALTYGKYLYDGNLTQVYAIAASIPILLYNGKRGAFSLKYFFYIIYPAHLLLLYVIHYILVNHLLPF